MTIAEYFKGKIITHKWNLFPQSETIQCVPLEDVEAFARSKCKQQREIDMEYLENCEDHYAYANAQSIKTLPLAI